MKANTMFLRADQSLSSALEEAIESGRLKATELELKAGDHLFREGDQARCTHFVKKGLLRLYASNAEGISKTIFFHTSGTLIGFQWFRENTHSLFNAQATTNCTVLRISSADYVDLLREDNELCFSMARYLFDMLSLQSWESINASLYSIPERFATLLLLLADEWGTTETPVFIPYSNDEFADMLGVHRNSISKAIKSLANVDCVERHGGSLIITDRDKLRTFVSSML